MMKSKFKHNLEFMVAGQSHDEKIILTIENIPAGYLIDFDRINDLLVKRQGNANFNTKRHEKTDFKIISGFNKINAGQQATTNGQVIEVHFLNDDFKSFDYDNLLLHPRPGHVDYVAKIKYGDKHDLAGGGHFSGLLTVALVFIGALCQQILVNYFPKLKIISHVKSFAGLTDISYYDLRKFLVDKLVTTDLQKLNQMQLQLLALRLTDNLHKILLEGLHEENIPTFNKRIGNLMLEKAEKLYDDSLGGQIETIVLNPPSFMGEPLFYSTESIISTLLFSIPSLKEVAFGNSEQFKVAYGTQVKDEIIFLDHKKLTTLNNNNGGINGGITNGEDLVFSSIIKPIASLKQEQNTYHLQEKKLMPLLIEGRHDLTIINRVLPIIDMVVYIALYDLFLEKVAD